MNKYIANSQFPIPFFISVGGTSSTDVISPGIIYICVCYIYYNISWLITKNHYLYDNHQFVKSDFLNIKVRIQNCNIIEMTHNPSPFQRCIESVDCIWHLSSLEIVLVGATKIFMRESEQTKLEYRLHQQIMASIITIQRWFRAVLERRRFLALRRASLVIQTYCRCVNVVEFHD